MNLVTAKIDSGMSAAATRKNRFETTIAGAASHTKRSTGGIFLSARTRSLQFGSGACLIAAVAAAIAGLSQVENIQVDSPGCLQSKFVSPVQTYSPVFWQPAHTLCAFHWPRHFTPKPLSYNNL